jgi:hypothetical protein
MRQHWTEEDSRVLLYVARRDIADFNIESVGSGAGAKNAARREVRAALQESIHSAPLLSLQRRMVFGADWTTARKSAKNVLIARSSVRKRTKNYGL